jgi:ATP-dependent DNA helicase RecG
MGILTIEDALYTLPFRYEDRRQIRKIALLREGAREVFSGEILAAGETQTARSRKKLYEVIVSDGTGQIVLKWFHYRREWMKQRFAVGRRVLVTGEVKRFAVLREVHHPDIELLDAGRPLEDYIAADPLNFGRILPVYPLTAGLHQKGVRRIWKEIVDRYAEYVISSLPPVILQRHDLLPLCEALRRVHWPPNESALYELESGSDAARRTLVFDELFFLELGLALKRRGVVLEKGIPFQVTHRYTKPLAALLPYRLTEAQRRVLGEIKQDLMAPHPMHRLVQGDVGCGKTIVALMAALVAIENDTQVAVVAPTEILAEQHFLQFHPWLEALGLKAVLLSGSIPAREKRLTLEQLRAGEVHLVVGTHAV